MTNASNVSKSSNKSMSIRQVYQGSFTTTLSKAGGGCTTLASPMMTSFYGKDDISRDNSGDEADSPRNATFPNNAPRGSNNQDGSPTPQRSNSRSTSPRDTGGSYPTAGGEDEDTRDGNEYNSYDYGTGNNTRNSDTPGSGYNASYENHNTSGNQR